MALPDGDLDPGVAGLRASGHYREARARAARVVLELEAAGPSAGLARALVTLGHQAEDLGDYPAATGGAPSHRNLWRSPL